MHSNSSSKVCKTSKQGKLKNYKCSLLVSPYMNNSTDLHNSTPNSQASNKHHDQVPYYDPQPAGTFEAHFPTPKFSSEN